MMLAPGTRLGSYEVVSLIGAGGMGEVYKARDVRLGRSVALKVLHADLASDPKLQERFEREGRAVSSLNHPRICTLYDISRHGGVEFLVMEFVEGQTLADRLGKGPLPIDLAVRITTEIAEALDHAHRRGITHRDLKPPNVMLTTAGVKLLDFGVAKLRDAGAVATRSLDRAVGALDTSATVAPLTDAGMLLGTFEYMAPEQLQGQEADERSDVFALGAVLYEMLTGRRAFAATTPAAVIGAVLMSDPPPIREIRPVSPLLDRIIAQCLAKDPNDRWQHVRDVQPPLRWVLDGIDASAPPAANPPRRWSRIAAALGAVVVLAGVGFPMWSAWVDSAAGPPDRWDVAPPDAGSFAADVFPSVAVSPDGRYIAFRAQSGGTPRLYLRRADDFESVAIPGTEGAHTPFFSSNGQWVGFFMDGNLHKASVAGGAPVFISSAPSLSPTSPGATWGADGSIVFAAGGAGLMRVRETGGVPVVLTTPDRSRGEVTHIAPQFIPGRREVLFSIRTTADQWFAGVLSLDSGTWDRLPPLGQIAGATYVADTHHLVYAQQRKLFAIPVDLTERMFSGPVIALPENVYTHVVGGSMVAQFAVSDNGVLAFMAGEPENRMLVRVNRDQSEQRITEEPHGFRYPRFSPANNLVTVTIEDDRSDVAVVDTTRGSVRKLTTTGAATTPEFTRDGLKVAFSWLRPGADSYDIYSVPVDGGAPPEPLLVGRPGGQFLTGWAPGDETFAFYELTNETSRDIWTWSPKTQTATKIAATKLNESAASFSRDGKWLAFVSHDVGSRQSRVYVQHYSGSGRPQVMSPLGGTEPVWSPTTDELYYRLGAKIMAVSIDSASGAAAREPRVIVEGAHVPAPAETGRPNYDVARDGSLVMVRSLDRSATHLHVVQRWFEELRAMTVR